MASSGGAKGGGSSVRGGGVIAPQEDLDKVNAKIPGMMEALTFIQHFYMFETDGHNLNANFLTIEGRFNFMKRGVMSSIYLEGFGFLVMFIFGILLYDAGIHQWVQSLTPRIPLNTFTIGLIQYFPVICGAGFCLWLATFYDGCITKISIRWLIGGRLFAVVAITALMFAGMLLLYGAITPERAATIARWTAFRSEAAYLRIYYFLMGIKAVLLQKAFVLLVIDMFLGVAPYLSLGVVIFGRIFRKMRDDAIMTP